MTITIADDHYFAGPLGSRCPTSLMGRAAAEGALELGCTKSTSVHATTGMMEKDREKVREDLWRRPL
jgi:hypothetical protein